MTGDSTVEVVDEVTRGGDMIIDLTDGAHVPTGSPGAELVDRATTDLPSGIETVVLVSGDGDFVPLVMQQQSRGLKVVVLSSVSYTHLTLPTKRIV